SIVWSWALPRARVDEHPLGGLSAARSDDTHLLVREQRLHEGDQHTVDAAKRDAVGLRHTIARSHPEHRRKAAVVAYGQAPVVGNEQRPPAVGLRRAAGQELGVEFVHRPLIARRRRASGARCNRSSAIRHCGACDGLAAQRNVARFAVIAKANAVVVHGLEPHVLGDILSRAHQQRAAIRQSKERVTLAVALRKYAEKARIALQWRRTDRRCWRLGAAAKRAAGSRRR